MENVVKLTEYGNLNGLCGANKTLALALSLCDVFEKNWPAIELVCALNAYRFVDTIAERHFTISLCEWKLHPSKLSKIQFLSWGYETKIQKIRIGE